MLLSLLLLLSFSWCFLSFFGPHRSLPSQSPSSSRCRSHPPPLCPLTTWHLFRFIPISWQTACVSPAGHNAAILMNQWQINQCYLFFPCLCCHRFLPLSLSLLICCLWNLQLCSIKLSSLSGTNCNSVRLSALRQTLMFVAGAFIYEMLRSERCYVASFLFFKFFCWGWTWIYWYREPSFQWGMQNAWLNWDFSVWARANV